MISFHFYAAIYVGPKELLNTARIMWLPAKKTKNSCVQELFIQYLMHNFSIAKQLPRDLP